VISEKKLLDYANVIAKIGVNVQKGQVVMIYAIVDAALLVKYVTEACYKLGAKQVIVRYDDIRVTSLGLKYCDLTTLTTIPKYAIDSRIDPIVNQHGCVIHIRGSDPNGLKGADPKKMIEIARVNQKVFGKLSNWTMSGKSQ
jgi:aminopeptidase